ncbi:MAG: thiE [Chloroflexi bacterium]|nr:thiE [Chloroflexota bacterium]
MWKTCSAQESGSSARALVRVAHAHDGLLVLNDRPDIAVAAGADGAHLGQDDLPIRFARELLGPDRVLGASASYLPELSIAIDEGADYLGFGAVFPTATKSDAEFAGLDLFEAACKQSTVPVVGIGGIDEARAPLVMRRGAAGVAVVSALFRAPSPVAAARSLLAATAEPGRAFVVPQK